MEFKIARTYTDENSGQKIHFIDRGLEDFDSVLELQKFLFGKLIENHEDSKENYIIFCEHPPVYTLGKSGDISNLLNTEFSPMLRKIERGGDITFHGPGQIVGYPILNLKKLGLGLKRYVSLIENAIIETLDEFNIKAGLSPSETGVWIQNEKPSKICAIGIRSSRFITMHGFAFNVSTDLSYYEHIHPCGIKDKTVTSLENEVGSSVDFSKVKGILLDKLLRALSDSFEKV